MGRFESLSTAHHPWITHLAGKVTELKAQLKAQKKAQKKELKAQKEETEKKVVDLEAELVAAVAKVRIIAGVLRLGC